MCARACTYIHVHMYVCMCVCVCVCVCVERERERRISPTFGLFYVCLIVFTVNAVNYGLSTLAFFGVGVNLVLFLTRVLQQENAEAANNVSKWTGTVYIFSLIGAFLSDSYWGRYLTCAIFQMIFLVVCYIATFYFPFLFYDSKIESSPTCFTTRRDLKHNHRVTNLPIKSNNINDEPINLFIR